METSAPLEKVLSIIFVVICGWLVLTIVTLGVLGLFSGIFIFAWLGIVEIFIGLGVFCTCWLAIKSYRKERKL